MTGDDDLFTPEGNQSSSSNAGAGAHSAGGRKSGCGMKFFLILLAAIGGLTILCCCGIGISLYSITPELEENPALVKQNLAKMLEIDLPEGYEAKKSFRMNLFSLISMEGVYIENPDSGLILLMEFSGSLAENKELQDSFKKELDGSSSSDELNIEEKKTREITIDGKAIPFVFIKGTEKETNRAVRQVQAILPGEKGPILFVMNVGEDAWDEEQVLKMLESIRIPKD